MAQNYFYNGTQLDTFDGTKGTIVSHVLHDSSPDASVAEVDVVRGNGRSLRDFRYSGKQITLDGTIIGESQADFEQRLDALKNLFASPNGRLQITNYGTLDYRIATFEHGEGWTRQVMSSGAGPMWNYTQYKIGTRALTVQASSGSGAKTASLAAFKDIGDFAATDTIKLWAYIDDATKLTSIRLRFETTAGVAYYSKTWSSSFTTGWNELTALRSDFALTGGAAWNTIANIELQVTGNNATAVSVSFDDLRVSTTTDSRNYDVTQTGALRLERQQHHAYWVDFSLTLTCSSGLAVATNAIASSQSGTTDIQHEPYYFPGSGPQYLTYNAGLGSAEAEQAVFYDHWADHFGGYGASTTAVASFESTETWTGGAADSTNVKVGARGWKVTATDPTAATAVRTISSTDYSAVPDNWETQLAVYVDDAAKLTNVTVRYESTAGAAGYSYVKTGLVTGWNVLQVAKSAFVQYGGGDWAAIVSLTLEVTPTGGTVNVTFDDWRWVDPQNCTGGVYTANADAWTIAAHEAYPHALINLSPTNDTTFVLTNTTVRDGELIALVNAADAATVGLCGRLSSTDALLLANYSAGSRFVSGDYTAGATTSFRLLGGQNDGGLARLNASQYTYAVDLDSRANWRWMRLVCKGDTATLYTREVDEDAWTLRLTAPIRESSAGYWGLHATGLMRVAFVELIDYANQQDHALALKGGPFGTDVNEGRFLLESRALQLREGPHPGFTSGTFPTFHGGFNRASFLVPAGVVGTSRFYHIGNDQTTVDWTAFGESTSLKAAIKVNSGNQTYIRQRGTFLYLGKLSSTPPVNDLTVRLETDSAGSPSGTLVHASATVSLSNEDIQTYVIGANDLFNASVVPYEIVWPIDIPVTASTDYWLVLTCGGAEAGNYWVLPNKGTAGPNWLAVDVSGSWRVFDGSYMGDLRTGYALLAGNTPSLANRERYSLHRPTFL